MSNLTKPEGIRAKIRVRVMVRGTGLLLLLQIIPQCVGDCCDYRNWLECQIQ